MTADETCAVEHHGCRLSYGVRGDGPPVLLIQGVGMPGAAWGPQVDALADRYRCLWYDNRGLGRSQPLGTALGVPQMADDARALMDTLGWESAHVVGHSLGGLVALHLALANRGRVRSLALLCTFARGRDVGRLSAWLAWVGIRMKLGTRRVRRRAFLEVMLPPGTMSFGARDAFAARLGELFGYDLATQPAVVPKQLAAMKAYDATPRLKELAGLPTLVVSAALDRLAPPALGRAIADGIPGARFVELADAAHGVPLQDPGRINAVLADHLAAAETPDRRSSP